MDAPSKIIPIVPAPATSATPEEVSLYEISRKIYPRAVSGWFAGWRWALVWLTQIVFYGLPWLEWNGRQAVLFELAARKFYIFGLVFWPQDVIYLSVLLILSAYALFLFTAVAGRLWCGYACPQTVYTEIFLWIERKIEGDRVARIRLDGEPLSARKFGKKAAKHAVWAAIGLWTGITFVGYFTPIRVLWGEAFTLALGPWETFWILFYGFATYGNAGWMREQVCKYMCPYARFQSVMFDKDTMIIAYDVERGEPRGARSRKADPKEKGLGHCVDCEICVQVCPTGIDIRKGLQYECIGCAACIDGCNQVMDKMGYPQGLIRYASQNSLTQHFGAKEMWKHVFRPRTLIYTGILLVIVDGGERVARAAQSAQGRRAARPRRARARVAAGPHRERLPAADHEHDGSAARVHDPRVGPARNRGRRRRAAGEDRGRGGADRADPVAGARRRRAAGAPQDRDPRAGDRRRVDEARRALDVHPAPTLNASPSR